MQIVKVDLSFKLRTFFYKKQAMKGTTYLLPVGRILPEDSRAHILGSWKILKSFFSTFPVFSFFSER